MEFQTKAVFNQYTMVEFFIGVIIELSQVFSAMHDTSIQPLTYTGSGNIGITDNQVSFNFPIKVNDEIVFHPRAYDGALFGMLSGTDDFLLFDKTQSMEVSLSPNFHSSTKACTFQGDSSIHFL